jgi:hypothetical protein
MSASFRAPTCRECNRLMRSIAASTTKQKFRSAARGDDDPMHSPDVWNLFKGELQPPELPRLGRASTGREQ